MAKPKIFVSSTCYDLQEIRGNLRSFISDFGYEPIMSDFGDIFYDFNENVQDSCIKAIQGCDMYILIIGNNYGSLYHAEDKIKETPDSITLKEFKKALEINKPKLIFINDYVNYDYQNYRRYLDKEFKNFFKKSNEMKSEEIEENKERIKKEVDLKYTFNKDTYKYIFHFLDHVSNLNLGNAYITFRTSEEIKINLKLQWAGFLQESLKKSTESLEKQNINALIKKITDMEVLIKESFTNDNYKKKDNELVFDINKITDSFEIGNLQDIQDQIEDITNEILYYNYEFNYKKYKRLEFSKDITKEQTETWLNNLSELVNEFKWSKYISIVDIFSGFSYQWWSDRVLVPYEELLKLNSIYQKLDDKEKQNFEKTIQSKLLTVYNNKLEKENSIDDDDFPF